MSSVALPCESVPLSPCIGVCKLNSATGLCEGCYRTLGEIAAWSHSSAAEKRAVLTKLEERRRTVAESSIHHLTLLRQE